MYVYHSGIKSGLIPLSTVVGVFKSLIGVLLLFGANGISKGRARQKASFKEAEKQ